MTTVAVQSNLLHCCSGKAICYIVAVQSNVLHCYSGKAICYIVAVAKQCVTLLQWQSNMLHCYSGKAVCYIVAVAKQCVTLLQWQSNVLHCCIVKYPSRGSRDVPFGQTDGRTYLRNDMTTRVVALREFCKCA